MLETHIQAGQQVLLKLPSQNLKVVTLEPGTTISLGKFGSFRADDLVGDPFGFTYEISNDMKLVIVDEVYEDNEEDEGLGTEQTRTGDKITASGLQQLTMAEIEELKKQGVSGEEIIARVTGGHEAFSHKTEYSKEKYLKRKKQKFLKQFTPVAIGSSELIDIYLAKDPQRIYNISVETLAMAISLANIRPGGNYLVADETPGVMVAAILERMDGQGNIVVAHENEHANLDCLKYLNLTEAQRKCVKAISWLDLLHPEESSPLVEKSGEELEQLKPAHRGQYFRHKQRENDRKWILEVSSGAGFDGLVLMTRLDLPSLVPATLNLIGGSKPIVIYSEYKENLVDTTLALQKDTRVLGPTIYETRVRRYQTLPGRIHPVMTSRGYGGYLLAATRVFPNETANALQKGRKRAKLEKDTKSGETETDKVEKTETETEFEKTETEVETETV